MKSPPQLLLASTSLYRRTLLERLQIPFECRSPGIDESSWPGEAANALAARLAHAKAEAVALSHPHHWVIGSDQLAVLTDGPYSAAVRGKPHSVEHCIRQLLECSGRTLVFITAVTVMRHEDSRSAEFIDTTRVVFRNLDRTEVERYVAREMPLDCAGGFKSEGLGISLCQSIDNRDPTALIGLPLIRLAAVLRGLGFDLP